MISGFFFGIFHSKDRVILISLVFVLLLIRFGFFLFNPPKKLSFPANEVEIEYFGQRTYADLNKFRQADGEQISAGQGEMITAFSLDYLATRAGIDLTSFEYSRLYFSTLDGQRMVVARKEFEEKRAMFMLEGALKARLRLIFPEESFRNRWLRNIRLIEIE